MGRSEKLHPYVFQAKESLKQGSISRREFLRLALLLGVSYPAAALMAGCKAPTEKYDIATPIAIKRDGTLHLGGSVELSGGNLGILISNSIYRLHFEHLTRIDSYGFTHPHLLDGWQANEDLSVWTLYLRHDIRWSNDEDFIADDVVQSLFRMLRYEQLTFDGILTRDGIELVDDYTVRLHLEIPKLDVPETLYSNSAIITHRGAGLPYSQHGNFTTTGPFMVEEIDLGKKARLVRRDGYWRFGQDGQPLPYLEALELIDLGFSFDLYVAALESGKVDAFYPDLAGYAALRENPKLIIQSIPSSRTHVLRFRVDQEPWNDNRVRLAVKKLQDRQKILHQALFGQGQLGHDTHVSPVHPEFAPMETPRYDPVGARALLTEAGREKLSFSISLIDQFQESLAYAETLREDARAAGVDISINKMTDSEYWKVWTTTPVGITPWNHRTLGVTVLPLAYTADSNGNPVAWNETRWVDDEFSALLAQAQGTLDLEARRAIMGDIQRIQSERGSIGIAFWMDRWLVVNPAFRDIHAHPDGIYQAAETWYDPDSDPFI